MTSTALYTERLVSESSLKGQPAALREHPCLAMLMML